MDGLFAARRCSATGVRLTGRVGFLYFDRKLLDFGKAFAIKLGTRTSSKGASPALEAHFPEGRPPELAVLAEDRLQDLRMTRRTRTFADVSDADVMRTHRDTITGSAPAVDVSGPTHKVLAQVNQSDLAFLRDRARAIDAELWMTGGTLHAKSHAKRQRRRRCVSRSGASCASFPRSRTSPASAPASASAAGTCRARRRSPHEAGESAISG